MSCCWQEATLFLTQQERTRQLVPHCQFWRHHVLHCLLCGTLQQLSLTRLIGLTLLRTQDSHEPSATAHRFPVPPCLWRMGEPVAAAGRLCLLGMLTHWQEPQVLNHPQLCQSAGGRAELGGYPAGCEAQCTTDGLHHEASWRSPAAQAGVMPWGRGHESRHSRAGQGRAWQGRRCRAGRGRGWQGRRCRAGRGRAGQRLRGRAKR